MDGRRRAVGHPPYQTPPALLSELLNLHAAAGHLARTAPDIPASTEVARAIEQALTRVLILCLGEGQAMEVRSAH